MFRKRIFTWQSRFTTAVNLCSRVSGSCIYHAKFVQRESTKDIRSYAVRNLELRKLPFKTMHFKFFPTMYCRRGTVNVRCIICFPRPRRRSTCELIDSEQKGPPEFKFGDCFYRKRAYFEVSGVNIHLYSLRCGGRLLLLHTCTRYRGI